jgi:Putative endonuclease segE, GIY-YIG domain
MDYGHWTNTAGDIPEECIGFIYRICNTSNNRKYIGKKLLKFKVTKKPLKGRVNKRRSAKESDWKTYTGSCNQLNEDIGKIGKDKFTFEILSWCKNKSDLSYEEIKQIILANALYDKDYYNEYVGGRVRIRKV